MILIAQLSDTHIRAGGALAYGKVDTAAFLRRAVEHLNAMQPRPDAVVVSGDLVDYGHPAEYEAFSALMAPLEIPYWPLPGNHDGDAIWDCLAPLRARNDAREPGYRVRVAELELILLDTRVDGRSGGALTATRIDWLDRALTDARPRPTLLFMHHPPFRTGIEHMDRIGLDDAARLAPCVARHDHLLAIGCGHLHRTIVARVGGVTAMTAPSPAHAVALDLLPGAPGGFRFEPPGFLLHCVDVDGSARHVAHQVYLGEFDGPHPFFDPQGRLV